MITNSFDNLWLASLTPEQHARTCDYWYVMTHNHGPFTAFRTRAALDAFLDLHDLRLEGTLPDKQGEHASMRVTGAVRHACHSHPEEMPTGREVLHLSNGQYTRGVVVEMPDGPVLHYLNCNATRPVYDHTTARRMIDAGAFGPLPPALSPEDRPY